MTARPIGITILGSTGTIGVNTLDVIHRHRQRFEVTALTANRNVDGLYEQCLQWQPRYAVMADEVSAEQLLQRLNQSSNKSVSDTEVLAGVEGLEHVAACKEADYVMAAIVGGAGLLPTLAAARAGKRVMLANKEALVMSGRLFMDAIREHSAQLLPIDSEHNAIFQCLPADFDQGLEGRGVERIWLTASGGPFRTFSQQQLENVTPDQACAHPNWVMGRKISVDSATMMNKGLEIIEACWLFNTSVEQINVVIHPQSVIHSLVEYADGSMLAQLGNPDMRTPIAYALAWPERMQAGVERLDLFTVGQLNFESPDPLRFPCLSLAAQAWQTGGTATAILNAANEVAVASFLDGHLKFVDIPRIIEHTLEHIPHRPATALDVILEDDKLARKHATETVNSFAIL